MGKELYERYVCDECGNQEHEPTTRVWWNVSMDGDLQVFGLAPDHYFCSLGCVAAWSSRVSDDLEIP